MTFTLFDQIADTLAARCRRNEDRALLSSLRRSGADVGSGASALELARAIRDGERSPETPELLAVLVAMAGDELAALTALVALRPVLATVTGYLVRRGMDADDAASCVVATTLELLRSGLPAGGADPLQALSSLVRSRCRKELRRLQRYRAAHVDDDIEGREPAGDGPEPDVTVLSWAVGRGVLLPHEARLIGETRLGVRRLEDLAHEWESSPVALESLRRRAEARLRRALVEEGVVA
jgi:hypothetical protein